MDIPLILFFILITSIVGLFYPTILPLMIIFSLLGLVYFSWKQQQVRFAPKSNMYKELEKLKKKRKKLESKKHKHIHDQITYINEFWGYTKEQTYIIENFIDERAYENMYNKFTASLFPQMIILIDNCILRQKKGCTRKVNKRIKELVDIMKIELKKKKLQNSEKFETTLEVYDELLKG